MKNYLNERGKQNEQTRKIRKRKENEPRIISS